MTIKEIAKLAQVSSAAVLDDTNGGYVSEEKEGEDSGGDIEETGYRPICTGETSHQTSRAWSE